MQTYQDYYLTDNITQYDPTNADLDFDRAVALTVQGAGDISIVKAGDGETETLTLLEGQQAYVVIKGLRASGSTITNCTVNFNGAKSTLIV